MNFNFELFLKNHQDIKKFTYDEDSYLLNKEEYDNIITNVVKPNLKKFNEFDPDEYIKMKKLECKKLKAKLIETKKILLSQK